MWFLIALAGPALYATTNLVDKVLLGTTKDSAGVCGLVTLSALASILLAGLALAMGGHLVLPSFMTAIQLALIGGLNLAALALYLLALSEEEPSRVVVHYSLTALFSSLLAWIFLSETIPAPVWGGIALIVAGSGLASGLSWTDARLGGLRAAGAMALASLCWSASGVLFKAFALSLDFWTVLLWENLALSFFGLILLLAMPEVRHWAMASARARGSRPLLALIAMNEAIYLCGNLVVAYAFTIAPVVLVLLANAFQPFFVLALAAIAQYLFGIDQIETTDAPAPSRKLVSITLAGLGVFLVAEFTNVP